MVNKTPWFDALGLMLAGSLGWVAIIVEIFYFYVLNKNFPSASPIAIALTCLLLAYVHYAFFIKDKEYERIYERYKSVGRSKKKTEKLVCATYIFVPLIMSMLIAMIWHKII